jgi:hypothetical protein
MVESGFEILEEYCNEVRQIKTAVARKLIRSLKKKIAAKAIKSLQDD